MKNLLLTISIAFLALPAVSQTETTDLNYKRSSLYTLMLSDEDKPFSEAIENSFISYPIPDKFNEHTIEHRSIPIDVDDSASRKERYAIQLEEITEFLNTNDIARHMVAKWFNRDEAGTFDMNLISERGNYNASDLDVKLARSTERGTALLADAGEELINNTFIVVNNFKHTNKEEVAKKASFILSIASAGASLVGAGDLVSLAVDTAAEGINVLGKGYVIKTDSYLYKLVWNEEIAATFYNDYWTHDNNLDSMRVKAFNETNLFKLEYVGMESAWADLQSTKYTTKTDEELVTVATLKASDAVIAKLQRTYEVFRTKTPLLSGNPITAKIGMKEGLEKGDKYEVLEQIINKKGQTEYKRVGVIKVDKKMIWDNRFMAADENENDSELQYTTFKGAKNKYYAGMLIRQIN